MIPAAEVIALDAVGIGRSLDDVAEIGNRFAGSSGERHARDYVLQRYHDLGLDEVRLEAFEYLRFEPAAASCAVVRPDPSELDCHPLQYTSPGPVSGEAVYLGEATEAELARIDRHGIDLAGRVVVAHALFPFDLSSVLEERRIAGFVHVCETPHGIIGNFAGALYPPPLSPPWPGRPTSYCGVTIAHDAGRALISRLSYGRPVELRLGHAGTYTEASASNVVGVIPGMGPVEDCGEVIVCAHYDSQAEGPCVYDNGSGLASLLATASALRDSRPRRRIVLVATAAEEVGVWGATAYATAHADELRHAAGMVNLDGIASAYPAQREVWSADAGMIALALETAARHGWHPDRVMNQRSTFGDHAPFGDAGVPSCLLWRPDHPYYHSRGDVRELVDERAVAETASVSATLIGRLASGRGGPLVPSVRSIATSPTGSTAWST